MSDDWKSEVEAETSKDDDNNKSGTSDSRPEKLFSNAGFLLFAIIFYGGLAWEFWLYDDSRYIEKQEVKSSIVKMIGNGADLEAVKHFYAQAPEVEWGFKYRWDRERSSYYPISTPLLTVLQDLKSDSYLNSEADMKQRETIQNLLSEYQQRNPFDGLEQSQKDSFESIRVKLGAKFTDVSSDFYKISEDLKQKNLLVNQYLSDSKTSLYLSIASLLFAFVTTFGSQYFYWKRKKKVKSE
ncbi:TPA: hypothetical protein NJ548_004573 [Vibrio parahaemolyticus]|uniref:hypothetical protein n=1 Tax=Vibrio parahaemolyticus TaxID=670 RepID=UPI0022043FEB|nr:hypothetical protein VA208B3_12640 [Vibrio alginolyticus]HCD5122192.1 hypothetical protein [Vibrio parahaemolyticus]HCG8419166.1 hypothetical protein [Vibrio parahaemolyticus]